ncbi:MAG: hypothetical protein LW629_09715, partial [Burkholderiales bacterium]|nr:hypothetical protein [Burkholderiales bacterium]
SDLQSETAAFEPKIQNARCGASGVLCYLNRQPISGRVTLLNALQMEIQRIGAVAGNKPSRNGALLAI